MTYFERNHEAKVDKPRNAEPRQVTRPLPDTLETFKSLHAWFKHLEYEEGVSPGPNDYDSDEDDCRGCCKTYGSKGPRKDKKKKRKERRKSIVVSEDNAVGEPASKAHASAGTAPGQIASATTAVEGTATKRTGTETAKTSTNKGRKKSNANNASAAEVEDERPVEGRKTSESAAISSNAEDTVPDEDAYDLEERLEGVIRTQLPATEEREIPRSELPGASEDHPIVMDQLPDAFDDDDDKTDGVPSDNENIYDGEDEVAESNEVFARVDADGEDAEDAEDGSYHPPPGEPEDDIDADSGSDIIPHNAPAHTDLRQPVVTNTRATPATTSVRREEFMDLSEGQFQVPAVKTPTPDRAGSTKRKSATPSPSNPPAPKKARREAEPAAVDEEDAHAQALIMPADFQAARSREADAVLLAQGSDAQVQVETPVEIQTQATTQVQVNAPAPPTTRHRTARAVSPVPAQPPAQRHTTNTPPAPANTAHQAQKDKLADLRKNGLKRKTKKR